MRERERKRERERETVPLPTLAFKLMTSRVTCLIVLGNRLAGKRIEEAKGGQGIETTRVQPDSLK